MKIYIEEKDVPESCFDCPFMLHRSFCLVNTKIEFTDEEYSELKGRYIGCPLVPLPPHGDLIDRGALVISTAVPLDGKPYQYVHIDHIKAAPAVIKAEESDMDSFIHIFEEDDEEDGMDSFIRILKE